MAIMLLGQMDNTLDHTLESANRVYGVNGEAPTIPTCGGGGHQPKILEIRKYEHSDKSNGEWVLQNIKESVSAIRAE